MCHRWHAFQKMKHVFLFGEKMKLHFPGASLRLWKNEIIEGRTLLYRSIFPRASFFFHLHWNSTHCPLQLHHVFSVEAMENVLDSHKHTVRLRFNVACSVGIQRIGQWEFNRGYSLSNRNAVSEWTGRKTFISSPRMEVLITERARIFSRSLRGVYGQ